MSYIEEYNDWLKSEEVDEKTKEELLAISDNESEIKDRFYKNLEFGTGGLRGVMGAGTNRMNIYTVRKATRGVAEDLIDSEREPSKRSVVIAYDSRNNSKIFAEECAKVFVANGIKTYIFDGLRPTPELSFAVRYLGCARGVVITASHNPKEYNGYKVYGEDGGQITPETAGRIIKRIDAIRIFDGVEICDDPNPVIIGEEVDKAYIEAIKNESFDTPIPEDFKVIYTPLHGAGNKPVRRILSEIGVKNVFVVPEQEMPDGDFPTVSSPNPENSEAFDIAIKYAKKENADLVFGTDPDSDRIGVVVRNKDGDYFVLNGNQTGCLLCEYILRKKKELGELRPGCAVVKTIVTTEMIKAIADDYRVRVIDVLTGFKFIGNKIKEFEEEGKASGFLFGLEESFGYLKGSYARDKDAVAAAMLIAEAAADYKSRDMTLYEGLMSLYEKYGYFLEGSRSVTLEGIDGAKKISAIMDELRSSPPDSFAGMKVKCFWDVKAGIKTDTLTGEKTKSGLPKSNVLKFELENNGWLAVRPSGTEPKIKFYFGVCRDSYEAAENGIEKIVDFIKKWTYNN